MASTAVAERPQQQVQQSEQRNPLVTLRHELEQRAGEFKMALPAHISPEKFQRTILTAVQSNPNLLNADRRSFITSCMKAAQDGLLPDGREAALVEFKTRQNQNGQWVDVRLVQYMPMVFGLRKKILQSGEVKDIFAAVVYRQEYESGLFLYEEGTERMLRHKPCLDAAFEPKDEDIIAAYSIATLADGSKVYEVMRRVEINKVREASQTGATRDRHGKPREPKGPWVDWFSEMAKKTVLRRHSKTLPMSGDIFDMEAIDEAAAARSAVRALASADEAPALPRRDDFDDAETPHDPITGEVIEAEKVEEKPKPRQRKAKEAQREETATDENPAAAERRADGDMGEAYNNDGEVDPRQKVADDIIAAAGKVGTIIDLGNLRAFRASDVAAMPEWMGADVEAAYAAAETRLKGGK